MLLEGARIGWGLVALFLTFLIRDKLPAANEEPAPAEEYPVVTIGEEGVITPEAIETLEYCEFVFKCTVCALLFLPALFLVRRLYQLFHTPTNREKDSINHAYANSPSEGGEATAVNSLVVGEEASNDVKHIASQDQNSTARVEITSLCNTAKAPAAVDMLVSSAGANGDVVYIPPVETNSTDSSNEHSSLKPDFGVSIHSPVPGGGEGTHTKHMVPIEHDSSNCMDEVIQYKAEEASAAHHLVSSTETHGDSTYMATEEKDGAPANVAVIYPDVVMLRAVVSWFLQPKNALLQCVGLCCAVSTWIARGVILQSVMVVFFVLVCVLEKIISSVVNRRNTEKPPTLAESNTTLTTEATNMPEPEIIFDQAQANIEKLALADNIEARTDVIHGRSHMTEELTRTSHNETNAEDAALNIPDVMMHAGVGTGVAVVSGGVTTDHTHIVPVVEEQISDKAAVDPPVVVENVGIEREAEPVTVVAVVTEKETTDHMSLVMPAVTDERPTSVELTSTVKVGGDVPVKSVDARDDLAVDIADKIVTAESVTPVVGEVSDQNAKITDGETVDAVHTDGVFVNADIVSEGLQESEGDADLFESEPIDSTANTKPVVTVDSAVIIDNHDRLIVKTLQFCSRTA